MPHRQTHTHIHNLIFIRQGIGRATALVFARKGYNVVVVARDLTKLQYVANDCEQASGRQGSSMAGGCGGRGRLPGWPASTSGIRPAGVQQGGRVGRACRQGMTSQLC